MRDYPDGWLYNAARREVLDRQARAYRNAAIALALMLAALVLSAWWTK